MRMHVEDFFVYPMITLRNVKKWKIKGYSYTLQMQNPGKRIGVDESWVRANLPKTYEYLKAFEQVLLNRAAYKKFMKNRKAPFYSMYNVGEYTYAPYKVVWNRMGSRITSCVVSTVNDPFLGEKHVLPDNVLSFIPADNEDEAHYICAVMNSAVTDVILRSLAGGTKSFGTPKIVQDTIKIPVYDGTNKIHKRLCDLSKKAHEAAKEDLESMYEIEKEVNDVVAVLYGISERELLTVLGILETKIEPKE